MSSIIMTVISPKQNEVTKVRKHHSSWVCKKKY
jgi:hypothetical protein